MDFGFDSFLYEDRINIEDEGELYGEDIDLERIEDEFDYI